MAGLKKPKPVDKPRLKPRMITEAATTKDLKERLAKRRKKVKSSNNINQ